MYWLALIFRIWKVKGSNLQQNIGYPKVLALSFKYSEGIELVQFLKIRRNRFTSFPVSYTILYCQRGHS